MFAQSALPLHLLLLLILGLLLLPQVILLRQAFAADGEFVLLAAPAMVWGLLGNTLLVSLLTVLLALVLGVGAACCVQRYAIPGRRVLAVLLCLPFAIPAYVLAGVAISACDHAWWHSVWGLSLLMGLNLYPWVYIPTKTALAQQSVQYEELAITLGLSRWQRLWRVHLWLLLPTVAVAALLVLVAVVAEIGAPALLGVKTLSVGLHDTFAMVRRDWAAQLAALGLILPVGAVLLFVIGNARRAAYQPSNRAAVVPLRALPPVAAWTITGSLALLLMVSLLLPLSLLLLWGLRFLTRMPLAELPSHVWDSVWVSILVTLLSVTLALVLTRILRRPDMQRWRILSGVVHMNYAIPGVMLGIALLFASADLPAWLSALVLSNSTALLVFGSCLAYLCFPFFTLRAGYGSLHPAWDDCGRSLGLSSGTRLWRIEIPLLRRFLAAGALLVLVCMLKELPLALTLQPFGYRPVSLRIHTYANAQLFEESALYSLCLLALAAYPVLALDRLIMRSSHAEL